MDRSNRGVGGYTGTYLADVCALDGDGERHDEEDHDALGAEEDCLQVGEDRAPEHQRPVQLIAGRPPWQHTTVVVNRTRLYRRRMSAKLWVL